jgi:hypothetical protein
MFEKGWTLMSSRLFVYSMKAAFSVASVVAITQGCAAGADDPVERPGSDTSALEPAAPVVGAAAKVSPGATLTRDQVVALVGKLGANSTIGGPCPTGVGIGQLCEPTINSVVRPCGGFTDVCDSTGTEDILPINVFCLPGASGNVCTAVASQTPQTVACTVSTDGKSCSTGCGDSFCASYPTDCATETNKVQDCLSNGVCSQDTCVNQTFTQNVVGTCTRLTEGDPCTPRQPCHPPTAPLCTVNQVCACLTGPQ